MSNPYDRWSSALKYFHDCHRQSLSNLCSSLSLPSFDSATAGAGVAAAPHARALKPAQLQAVHRALLEFLGHLHMHHTIEDQSIFPLLFKKIPEFVELGKQHEHLDGLIDQLSALARVRVTGDAELDVGEHVARLRSGLAGLRALVLPHMAAEEALTAPDKMRPLFTEREMGRILGQ